MIRERIVEINIELQNVQKNLAEDELIELSNKIMEAENVFFSAQGRSGDMVKALAIRFMHLGINAYVAGESSTSAIKSGDLLIAVSSSAKTKVTLNHLETAEKVGAETALITSVDVENNKISSMVICIPIRSKIDTDQHAGSLFEQSVLILGDAIAWYIQKYKHIDTEIMNARHANLQ